MALLHDFLSRLVVVGDGIMTKKAFGERRGTVKCQILTEVRKGAM